MADRPPERKWPRPAVEDHAPSIGARGVPSAFAVIACAVLAAALASRAATTNPARAPSAMPADGGPARVSGPRFFLAEDGGNAAPTNLAYRFRWRSAQTGTIADHANLAGNVVGEADVVGTLFVSLSTTSAGTRRIAARLSDVRVARWTVAELDLAEQNFGAGIAILQADAGGALHDLGFSAETSPGARMLLRAVLSHALHRAEAAASTSSADERTSIGTAATDFTWGTPRLLRARRVRYLALDAVPLVASYTQDVRSHAEWAFASDRAPSHVHEEEHVALRTADGAVRFESDLAFDLDRSEDEPPTVETGAAITTREPLDASESTEARHERLVRRVDGLTEARLHDRVTIAASGGGPEGDAKFLFRATGLLLLEPATTDRLADRLLATGGAGHGDELVVDLLTFAGDAPSQAALRRVLSDPRVRAKPIYPLLVQRLALVAAPSRDTATFCLALANAAPEGSDLHVGAHYAMGAIAGRLVRGGDDGGAEEILRELEKRLLHATNEPSRVHALRAIGNAGIARHAALVTAEENTRSASAEVRRATADTTRAFLDSGTLDAAFSLACDADPSVAEAAVRALGERPLALDDRTRLSRLAREGRVPHAAAAAVVEVMRLQPPPEADARATLAVLAIRHTEEPALRARISALAVELAPPLRSPEEIR